MRNRKLFCSAKGKRTDAFQRPRNGRQQMLMPNTTRNGAGLGTVLERFLFFSWWPGRCKVEPQCRNESQATDFSFCPVFHAAAGRISSFRGVTQVAECSKLPPAPGPNGSCCHRVAVACSPATASVPPDHRSLSPRSSLSRTAVFADSPPDNSRYVYTYGTALTGTHGTPAVCY